MAATEITASSAMGSSAILSIKPLHPSYEFGRSYKKQIPSLQASMAGKEDRGATMRKPHEDSSSRSSGVSSLLKAVQEGGSSVVLQQVSSIRHFFMPELPHAIIREIKKRMALSFKDEDDEESAIQDDLNGGLLEKDLEEQVTLMGPRCAWPRLKLVNAEAERQEATQGPRCAWPRPAQTLSSSSSVQEWKQEERTTSTIGEGANRGNSRNYYQSNKESLEKEALTKSVKEGKEEVNSSSVSEGPRCAWPRSTPARRMIATGVGLGLMNYLFIGQGAPALAILVQTPLPIICEEDPCPHKSLLP